MSGTLFKGLGAIKRLPFPSTGQSQAFPRTDQMLGIRGSAGPEPRKSGGRGGGNAESSTGLSSLWENTAQRLFLELENLTAADVQRCSVSLHFPGESFTTTQGCQEEEGGG